MSSSAALLTALRCKHCYQSTARRVYNARSRILGPGKRALGTTAASDQKRFDHTSIAASLLCVSLIGAGAFVAGQEDSSEASESWIQKIRTLCEPRGQPKNVMLHRKRSLRGRSLNEKYNVNWHTVLGEGAYGSVHPARLAATGEKVSYLRNESFDLSFQVASHV